MEITEELLKTDPLGSKLHCLELIGSDKTPSTTICRKWLFLSKVLIQNLKLIVARQSASAFRI